jgi:hypothetical protein
VLLLQSHLSVIPNGCAEEQAALFSRCFLREAVRCVFLNLVGKAVAAARFVEFVLRAPHRLGVTYSSVRASKVCTRVNWPTSALSSGGKNDGDLRNAGALIWGKWKMAGGFGFLPRRYRMESTDQRTGGHGVIPQPTSPNDLGSVIRGGQINRLTKPLWR